MHFPTALLCLTVHSQIPFLYFSHALSKHPPLSHCGTPQQPSFTCFSPALLYTSLCLTVHSLVALLFLTVHFPTALPNAVWSPLCNIMCVGEWFGENVLSVKQPHSPHRLQKKREREREREREKERYLSITLICCGWSATTFYQQDWRLPVPYHATLLTSQERPA